MSKPTSQTSASIVPRNKLIPREDAESAPFTRAYTCGSCKSETLVSDSSLTGVTNPFGLVLASVCAGCGPTPLSVLRWSDTGETVADFRRRMWRLTAVWVKLVQYLVLPGLLGMVAFVVIENDEDVWEKWKNLAVLQVMIFSAIFFVTNAILWLTPLGKIVPAIFGMKYHQYK